MTVQPKKVHQIAPSLSRLASPVDELKPHDENYRVGNVEAIQESLQRFGQVKPIVVQESTGRIVAGNHTYAAAVALGWTHVAAARIELDDEEARAYLVADNRLSDIASNDDDALARILQGLQETGRLEGTGFNADEVDDLLATLAQLPTVEPDEFTGDHSPNRSQYDPDLGEPGERVAGAGSMPHREIVLVYTVEQADKFGQDVRRLSKVYETTGTAATILAVVADAVRRADAPAAK